MKTRTRRNSMVRKSKSKTMKRSRGTRSRGLRRIKMTKGMRGGRRSGKKKQVSKTKTKATAVYDEPKKLRCRPDPNKKKGEDFTCYNDEDMYKLRDLWNIRHPDATIETDNVADIWRKMESNLQNVCSNESCWLKQNFVDKKDRKTLVEAFAPTAPKSWKKKPNEWLSSTEIIDVMRQYEKAYKCFQFMGPSPIDYDTRKLYGECIWQELCQFNLKEQLKKGKKKFGIIFNLDPHYMPGSHWVSLFINTKKKQIYYFDSAGEKVPERIKKFADTIIQQGKACGISFRFDQNYPVEHQYGDTECGIYSIYFIVHMLEDKINDHYLKTHILKDEYIEKFRKVYFNDSDIMT